MSESKFKDYWQCENIKELIEAKTYWGNDSSVMCEVRTGAEHRLMACIKGCNGIKNPNKTISELVKSSKFAIDAMNLMLDDLDNLEDKNTVYFAIQELKEALEGVSDDDYE